MQKGPQHTLMVRSAEETLSCVKPTRNRCNRIHTTHLSTVHASVAIHQVSGTRGPQINTFEEVAVLGYQMSLTGVGPGLGVLCVNIF